MGDGKHHNDRKGKALSEENVKDLPPWQGISKASFKATTKDLLQC